MSLNDTLTTRFAMGMAKKTNHRRAWGTLRTLSSGQIRASYSADDGRVYFAQRTFDANVDAEGWLANERKLLDIGEWTPPETRNRAFAGITLHDYAEKWLEQRDLTPKSRVLYRD